MPCDGRETPPKVVLFFPPGPPSSSRMHYVVKSGRSAVMRGMLKRTTMRASTVVAPHAQPSRVSNDLAFFLPCFHTVLSLRRCSSVADCWRSRPAMSRCRVKQFRVCCAQWVGAW